MKKNRNAERRRRENRGAEGAEGCGVWGGGVSLPTGGGDWGWGCAPSPEFFFDFGSQYGEFLVHSGWYCLQFSYLFYTQNWSSTALGV